MKIRHMFFTLMALSIFANSVFAVEKMYVRSKVAKIYSAAAFSSTLLKTVKQSEELEVISQQGNWSQVKSGDIEGWMPSLLLSNTKPIPRVSTTTEREDSDLQDSARRRASTTTVAGAARGLQSGDGDEESNEANYELLKKIENNVYTDEEIQKFMQEGNK